jgi:hypothetical protein
MTNEKKDISIGIRRMKTGMIYIPLDFGLKISFGIRKQSQNPLEIQIIELKILILK